MDLALLNDISQWLTSHPWIGVGLSAFSVLSVLGAAILTPRLLVALPADYFTQEKRWRDHLRSLPNATWMVLRNALGAGLLLLGIALLFLPGQGILTILLGLGLLDVPGRRQVVGWLLRRPRLRRAIDRLRSRAGQAPLEL